MFNLEIDIVEKDMRRNNSVCVIIPTYRSKELTARTVLSLISRNGDTGYDIILVDNEGHDHEHVIARARETGFGNISYLVLKRNVGCAGALYAGQKACYEHGYEYFIMADNDAEMLRERGIDILVASLRDHDLVLPTNVDPDRGNGESRELRFFGLMHYLTLSRETIDKVGFVNHEYFMNMEDLDYVTRAKSMGLKASMIRGCVYYHPRRKISLFYNPTIYFTIRNHLIFIFNNPHPVRLRYRLLSLLYLLLFLAVKMVHAVQLGDASIISTVLVAFRDFASRNITLDLPQNNFVFKPVDSSDRGSRPRFHDLNRDRNRVLVRKGYRVSDGAGTWSCFHRCARPRQRAER